MDLKEVESTWNTLVQNEQTLEKQLEEARQEKIKFFKKAVDEGFYWFESEWENGDE